MGNNSVREKSRSLLREQVTADQDAYQNGFPYKPFFHDDSATAIAQVWELLPPENQPLKFHKRQNPDVKFSL